MNTRLTVFAGLLLMSYPLFTWGQDPPADSSHPGSSNTAQPASVYDEQADAKKQIAGALAIAQRDHKRVLLQWGANWCGWCRLLHGTFESDRKVKDKLAAEYEVVLIDIGRMDKNMDLVAQYGADPKGQGVPFLTVLDAAGKVVTHQETGSLEKPDKDNPAHDPDKIIAFLDKHKAEPQDAQAMLEAALTEARSKNAPVMIAFGAYWCVWCHHLENWLAKPDIERIFKPRVVSLKIDVDRMTNGKALLEKYGGQGQGLPFTVFVAADGTKIADSLGPNGNIGYPATDDEIAQFIAFVKRAIAGLPLQDVATIQSSLKASAPK